MNSSRGIIYNWRSGGYNEYMYQQAARDAAIRMAEEIRIGGWGEAIVKNKGDGL